MKRRIMWGLLLLVLGILCACGQSGEAKWQEQYDLGVRYLSEGNYQEAIVAFTAAIEIDPQRPEAYIGRGDAYALSGDTEESLAAALRDYEEAIALDETLPEAWLGLADVYIRRGDYDKAMEILREALEKTGGDRSIAGRLLEMEGGSFADSAGRLRRLNGYDGAGNLIWYHIYTYNGEGRQSSVTSFDAAGNQTSHLDLTYTEAGDPIDWYSYPLDSGAVMKFVYAYDAAGNAVRWTEYDLDGEVLDYAVSEYDENGNKVREAHFGPNGEDWGYQTFAFDEQGRAMGEKSYAPDGALVSYSTWEYNEDGTKRNNFYDKDGVLTSSSLYLIDSQGNYLGYEGYDGQGNLIYSTIDAE